MAKTSAQTGTGASLLPRFEVLATVDEIDPGKLRVIWADEADEGIGDNRLYTDLTGAEWTEVEEVIAAGDEAEPQP
jgi:hypothetical protein